MTFQCLVIQRVKSVMNTVTDKKSVTLLSHRNGWSSSLDELFHADNLYG